MDIPCVTTALNAQPVDNKLQHNQVQFSAEVVKEIDKDELQVTLYLQEEGKDASALNQLIVARMNQALDAVKNTVQYRLFLNNVTHKCVMEKRGNKMVGLIALKSC